MAAKRYIPPLSSGTETARDESLAANLSPLKSSVKQTPYLEDSFRTKTGHNSRKQKKIKTAIKLATLNIQGRGQNLQKFQGIEAQMAIKKIDILAIQEAHLTEQKVQELEDRHPNLRVICNSYKPNKEGTAFLIHKKLMQSHDKMITNSKIIAKERIQSITVELDEEKMRIYNIYLPNEEKRKVHYLKKLVKEIKKDKMHKIIILGDWNCVHDPLDRSPAHPDSKKVTKMLDKLMSKKHLVDGWRNENQDKREFTHTHKNSGATNNEISLSRIDRIVITKNLQEQTGNWSITELGISDHSAATVSIEKANTPEMGQRPWRMSSTIIHDKKLTETHKEILNKAEEDIKNFKIDLERLINESDKEKLRKLTNPQLIWQAMKAEIKTSTIQREKEIREAMIKPRNKLKNELKKAYKRLAAEEKSVRLQARKKIQKCKNLMAKHEQRVNTQAKRIKQARHWSEGEKNTKYWYSLNKEGRSENVINVLKDKENKPATDSRKMAEIAAKYHENLQANPPMDEERREAMQEILRNVETKLSPEEQEMLGENTKYPECKSEIGKARSNTAPGIDGIIYEWYKLWSKEIKAEENRKEPNVARILTWVLQDIENYGTINGKHAEGIMYLLYKKKDKASIENYRPLTLLNTDYKIHTKVIARRISKVAGTIIHEDQAGFIPNRQITSHTRTSQLMPEYCEAFEEKAMMVALDQEKAYDKISHEYLWAVLERVGFPQKTIETIKALYDKATTKVLLNGFLSRSFEINRGVRQGCSQSCLIYDIAIEPLACTIRKEINGIQIKGRKKLLKCKMFADDTLVYLGKSDSIKTLNKCTDLFCKASTAVFNKTKTEYLPMGTLEFREEVYQTGKLPWTNEEIPHELIVKENQLMRTLGCWVGNNINLEVHWESILEKCRNRMNAWSIMRPTLQGKTLILKALIHSNWQYLATVNNMPKDIKDRLEKMTRTFLWQGKKGLINKRVTIAPRKEGGLDTPDIEARYDAIMLKWLQRWAKPNEEKEEWASIVSAFLNKNAKKGKTTYENSMFQDWLTQEWQAATQISSNSDRKVPIFIREMIQVAKKYNAQVYTDGTNDSVKEKMPLWYHLKKTRKGKVWNSEGTLIRRGAGNHLEGKKATNWAITAHVIRTVADAMEYLQEINEDPETYRCPDCEKCEKIVRNAIENIAERWNPTIMTPTKDGLEFTPRRREAFPKGTITDTPMPINMEIRETSSPHNAITIFGQHNREPETPPRRKVVKGQRKATIQLQVNIKKSLVQWVNKTEDVRKNKKVDIRAYETKEQLQIIAVIDILKTVQNYQEVTLETEDVKLAKLLLWELKDRRDKNFHKETKKNLMENLFFQLYSRGGVTRINVIPKDKKDGRLFMTSEIERLTMKNLLVKIPNNWRNNGAKLKKLKTKEIYEMLIERKKGAIKNPQIIKKIEDEVSKKAESRVDIGKLLKNLWRNPDQKIAEFMWKIIFKLHRTGIYFAPFKPEYVHCKCNPEEEDSVEHVVTKCKKSGQEGAWQIAARIWKNIAKREEKDTVKQWSKPNMNAIIYAELVKTNSAREKQLMAIKATLLQETAWLLWKCRCEREIQQKVITSQEIQKRLVKRIRERIEIEWQATKLRMVKPKQNNHKREAFRRKWGAVEIIAKESKTGIVINFPKDLEKLEEWESL